MLDEDGDGEAEAEAGRYVRGGHAGQRRLASDLGQGTRLLRGWRLAERSRPWFACYGRAGVLVVARLWELVRTHASVGESQQKVTIEVTLSRHTCQIGRAHV